MKKHLLLFAFVLTASAMRAQNNDMYSIMYHDRPGRAFVCEGLMQQRDCDFVINSYVYENDGGNFGSPLGSMFYKMSLSSLAFTDSLFVNDTDDFAHSCQFAQHPNGEGNILTKWEYREDCDSCFLHVFHFSDNDLNPVEDVVTPVCDGYAIGQVSLVDPCGDLIVQYQKIRDFLHYDEYAARFGCDGTLKHQALLSENTSETHLSGQLLVLKESPLTYFQWGKAETSNLGWNNIAAYTLDSLFNRNPIIISSILSTANEYIYYDGGDTKIIPAGGDDVLIGSKYVHEVDPQNPLQNEYGVVVAKYNLRTMQLKGYVTFNDYPNSYDIKCLGFKMMTDGTVYFLYKEEGYPKESFIAVKMDTNLNVEWKRFCKTDDIVYYLQFPVICKDEQGEETGIAWLGVAARDEFQAVMDFVFLYLHHDGTVGVSEGGIEVRPYCFYPNPTQDMLRMQYSPDVQPARVELYDLQGRLVRTQSKAFESIDMSQLPAGTYTLRVTLEDGKTYSDKVVKE